MVDVGAADPRCKVLIVMGRTSPDAAARQRQSVVLCRSTPRRTIVRSTPVFGWQDRHGHCGSTTTTSRPPTCFGEEGSGFATTQAGAGPYPPLQCVRWARPGSMVNRVRNRVAFGPSASQLGRRAAGVAQSRNEIDQARLLAKGGVDR